MKEEADLDYTRLGCGGRTVGKSWERVSWPTRTLGLLCIGPRFLSLLVRAGGILCVVCNSSLIDVQVVWWDWVVMGELIAWEAHDGSRVENIGVGCGGRNGIDDMAQRYRR